jgi:hypothetical protein
MHCGSIRGFGVMQKSLVLWIAIAIVLSACQKAGFRSEMAAQQSTGDIEDPKSSPEYFELNSGAVVSATDVSNSIVLDGSVGETVSGVVSENSEVKIHSGFWSMLE